jgi:hypothetical protein
LTAVGVALVVCLFLDMFLGWSILVHHLPTAEIGPLAAVKVFPAY